MAERRSRRRERSSGSESRRPAAIPEPTRTPLTYRGRDITPGHIVDLWREGMASKRKSRERILKCRALRRGEDSSLVKLAASWARVNPEAAAWVQEVLEERKTLDRDMVARLGAVEPEFTREALGFTQRDDDDAEAFASFLEEWRLRQVPTQPLYGKLDEDGECGTLCLPTPEDLAGVPDFFEYLDERAYERLDSLQRSDYARDEDDPKGRYVKRDQDGRKSVRSEYRRDRGGTRDVAAEKAAHDEAVQRYLLHCQASAIRIVPALECAPILTRGTGRKRWELTALVERTLYYVSELQEMEYAWQGMGSRLLVPLAYGADGTRMEIAPGEVGQGSQVYLYAAYLLCRDEDGHKRPVIAYTVGGAATWDSDSGSNADSNSVATIDLYDRYKLKDGSCPALDGVRLWDYHFGLHSEDDDADYYAEPYIWSLYQRIRTIEGNKTSINAAITTNAFTGHLYQPDAALAAAAPEAVIEQDGELIVPEVPGPGELKPAAGPVVPFSQARIGADAWQQLAADQAKLQAAVALDQTAAGPNASGSSQIVRATLAQTAKRHIRDGVLDAVVSLGERQVRIWHAIYQKYGIRWPLQTTQQRPVGQTLREGRAPLAYDPAWVGDGHFNLAAAYPDEANPVEVDLERSLKKDGLSTTERVLKKNGVKDVERMRVEILKDQLREGEPYKLAAQLRIAQKRGDRDLVTVIKALQDQNKMAKAGVPGAPQGIPMAALNRASAPGGSGQGMFPSASDQRGGEMAGQQAAAAAQQQAQQAGVA